MIANYFGGETSIGIDNCCHLDCDNYDNGVYIIEGWKIVGRQYHDGAEQHNYDLCAMLVDIDTKQSETEQLGKEKIKELLEKE